jgi:hypothetical protein
VDSAGVSLGRRPAATTATAVLAALRGKKILHIFQDFFFQEKICVWRKILKFMSEHSLKIPHKICLTRCK